MTHKIKIYIKMSAVLLLTEASVFGNMLCIRDDLSDETFVSGIV